MARLEEYPMGDHCRRGERVGVDLKRGDPEPGLLDGGDEGGEGTAGW